MAKDNKVSVIFEAVMGNFQKGIKLGMRSVLGLGDAGKEVRKHFKGVNDEVNEVTKSLDNLQQTAKKIIGAVVAKGIGKAVVGIGSSFVEEYAKTQTAIGEMASLGYESSELLRETAIEFSNKWAETSRDGFISAAYSIKSGIASLTDEGVAAFTELAGLTAKATKASVDEMTSLFAMGYGIYRNLYEDDFAFGEAFSSGIAKGVQLFRTSGSEMSSYLSTLGASAVQAGVELSEVINIGGTLQATMTGSEAATKYNSFLKNAVKASRELGMTFTDSNNRLLPAVEIIEQIKNKYGQILDANEQVELAQAFGDDEAIKFITGLYNKTEELKKSQKEVVLAIDSGRASVEEMANAMNRGMGEKIQLIKQRWANLKDEMGKQMEPGISPALDAVGDKLLELQDSADFSLIGQSVGEVINAISEVFTSALNDADSFISGLASGLNWLAENFDLVKTSVILLTEAFVSFKIASALAPIIYAVGGALGLFTTATGGATAATWSFTAAIKANPIGFIASGLTVVIMLLIEFVKWIITSNGGMEEFGKTLRNTLDKGIIKFNEFKLKFLEVVQSIVKNIPLIGKKLSDSLDKEIEKSKKKIDELDERIKQRIKPSKDEEEPSDSVAQKESVLVDEGALKEVVSIPLVEKSAAGSPKDQKKRTIKDDISDISNKYEDKIDLYESRAELAEKQKDKNAVKSNKESMMTVLREQVADLLKLEGKIKGKDKNIVETAKNKLLSKIADIAEEIKGGINDLVGSFNTPSGLTAMTNYEYLASTSKVANSKYVNTNNIEVLFNVKDLGNLTPAQINDKITAIAAQIGGAFGMNKDALTYFGMNDVSRN